jgi:hypothetical protein
MSCHVREQLERTRRDVDRMAYSLPLGSAAFDQWLSESDELKRAIDMHLQICPVCKNRRAASLVA